MDGDDAVTLDVTDHEALLPGSDDVRCTTSKNKVKKSVRNHKKPRSVCRYVLKLGKTCWRRLFALFGILLLCLSGVAMFYNNSNGIHSVHARNDACSYYDQYNVCNSAKNICIAEEAQIQGSYLDLIRMRRSDLPQWCNTKNNETYTRASCSAPSPYFNNLDPKCSWYEKLRDCLFFWSDSHDSLGQKEVERDKLLQWRATDQQTLCRPNQNLTCTTPDTTTCSYYDPFDVCSSAKDICFAKAKVKKNRTYKRVSCPTPPPVGENLNSNCSWFEQLMDCLQLWRFWHKSVHHNDITRDQPLQWRASYQQTWCNPNQNPTDTTTDTSTNTPKSSDIDTPTHTPTDTVTTAASTTSTVKPIGTTTDSTTVTTADRATDTDTTAETEACSYYDRLEECQDGENSCFDGLHSADGEYKKLEHMRGSDRQQWCNSKIDEPSDKVARPTPPPDDRSINPECSYYEKLMGCLFNWRYCQRHKAREEVKRDALLQLRATDQETWCRDNQNQADTNTFTTTPTDTGMGTCSYSDRYEECKVAATTCDDEKSQIKKSHAKLERMRDSDRREWCNSQNNETDPRVARQTPPPDDGTPNPECSFYEKFLRCLNNWRTCQSDKNREEVKLDLLLQARDTDRQTCCLNANQSCETPGAERAATTTSRWRQKQRHKHRKRSTVKPRSTIAPNTGSCAQERDRCSIALASSVLLHAKCNAKLEKEIKGGTPAKQHSVHAQGSASPTE